MDEAPQGPFSFMGKPTTMRLTRKNDVSLGESDVLTGVGIARSFCATLVGWYASVSAFSVWV